MSTIHEIITQINNFQEQQEWNVKKISKLLASLQGKTEKQLPEHLSFKDKMQADVPQPKTIVPRLDFCYQNGWAPTSLDTAIKKIHGNRQYPFYFKQYHPNFHRVVWMVDPIPLMTFLKSSSSILNVQRKAAKTLKKLKTKEKPMKKKVVSHLKEDIKGYQKQKKNLDKEIKEDKKLVKSVKKARCGKK